MAQSEAAMENALIKQLTRDISQWTYRKDIVDEDSLWANFRRKLNQNNQAVLDGEMDRDGAFAATVSRVGARGSYRETHAQVVFSGDQGSQGFADEILNQLNIAFAMLNNSVA